MASGYDLSSRVSFRLMKGRLGVYDKKSFETGNDLCSAGVGDAFPAGGVYEFSDPLAFDDHAADGFSRVEYPGYAVA